MKTQWNRLISIEILESYTIERLKKLKIHNTSTSIYAQAIIFSYRQFAYRLASLYTNTRSRTNFINGFETLRTYNIIYLIRE